METVAKVKIKEFLTPGNIFLLILILFVIIQMLTLDTKRYAIDKEIAIDGAVYKIKQATFYKYKKNPDNLLGELNITGYLTITNQNRYQNYEEFRKDVNIFTSAKEGRSTGFTYSYGGLDTFKLINCRIKVPVDNNGIKIFVENRGDNSSKELIIEPFWENILPSGKDIEHNLFIRQYGVDTENVIEPEGSIYDITSALRYNDLPDLKLYILPGSKAESNWTLLQHNYWDKDEDYIIYYVGEYQNHHDVYVIKYLFGERDEEYKLIPPIKEQNIYLILNEEDEFRVLSVEPLRDYN